jgi:hypothetical protein
MSERGEHAEWREQRRLAAAVHGAAEDRRRAREAVEARALIAEFVREAGRRGLAVSRLTARAYDGGARYRTGLRGWYLRRDRSIAVGTDGEFYILTVPASLRARLAGARPRPDLPRLVVGQGARDGESMPLQSLLRQRLDAGDDWS